MIIFDAKRFIAKIDGASMFLSSFDKDIYYALGEDEKYKYESEHLILNLRIGDNAKISLDTCNCRCCSSNEIDLLEHVYTYVSVCLVDRKDLTITFEDNCCKIQDETQAVLYESKYNPRLLEITTEGL